MNANGNIGTVQALYEAFGRGDVAAILDRLTDDVDWAVEAESSTAPWYGQRTGKDEVARFFEDLGGAVETQEFTPLGFATSDTEVMVLIRFRFTARESGREASMQIHHYWRFRDGEVEQWRGSEDTELTASLLA